MRKWLSIVVLCTLAACNNHASVSKDASVNTDAVPAKAANTTALSVPSGNNYAYDKEYEFRGYLMKQPVIEDGSPVAVDSFYCIRLDHKINVINTDTTDELSVTENNVELLQLAPQAGVVLKGHFYTNVVLKGSLFHADNGHHRTDVLIEVKAIK
jgi:Domain of unknown function (DUF4431)